MVNLYANRIVREAGKEGAFTIDNVPGLWNASTLTELNKRGLDGYGQPLKK
ncbi:hypothetical protein [Lysinibacillus boronitolerans]|uniref:hypothetical protein n=1 Tax=Lysinibacillus boronitolerans TaxID=309788 RepID=UPI0038536CDF